MGFTWLSFTLMSRSPRSWKLSRKTLTMPSRRNLQDSPALVVRSTYSSALVLLPVPALFGGAYNRPELVFKPKPATVGSRTLTRRLASSLLNEHWSDSVFCGGSFSARCEADNLFKGTGFLRIRAFLQCFQFSDLRTLEEHQGLSVFRCHSFRGR